ncbi:MAG: transposase [Cohaesibacteraceae bacterium]|nr:transposase [Cohaesibacteraceae bacterium]
MKDWWTRAEMIEAGLPGLGSHAAINRIAKLASWSAQDGKYRKKYGRGGGFEIHQSLLPEEARISLCVKQSDICVDTEIKRGAAIYEADHSLDAYEQTERDARLVILASLDRFILQSGLKSGRAIKSYIQSFNDGHLSIDAWVRDAIPRVSRSSLFEWRKARNEGNFAALSVSRKGKRKQRGILDLANEGAVKTYVLALVAKQPQLTAKPLRAAILKRFGDELEILDQQTGEINFKPVPVLRTLQHVLSGWKDQYRSELLRLTNPDAYKSTVRMVAAGGASAHIQRLNQLWEIDASPADVMTTDGRWNIYACIDVWSRRMMVLVTKTPRASAVGLLVRNAIGAWGVPEGIKTDNGSDFIAKQTKRLFGALDIEQLICDPFSPEQKPHVERCIGTWQRGFARLLPGFVGHSVADRSIIENRKRFSARLGTSVEEIFDVSMSPQELQEASDTWVERVYSHAPHAGLNGTTPVERVASWIGNIRTVDHDALNVLLAPIASGNGVRQMTKSGIRVNNEHYLIGNVAPGETVFCRMDPADLGKLWVYSEDDETFIGHAVAPVIAGLDPEQTIRQVRRLQRAIEDEQITPIRHEMKKIGPRDVLNAVLEENIAATIVAFPKPEQTHTTPELQAAGETHKEIVTTLNPELDALMSEINTDLGKPAFRAPTTKTVSVTPIKSETPVDRYRRARELEQRIRDGLAVTERDALWVRTYRTGSEYTAQQALENDFGGVIKKDH